MVSLKIIGNALVILGAAFGLYGLFEEFVVFIGVGVSSAVSGVLFLALDRLICLLTEIRDALRPADHTSTEVSDVVGEVVQSSAPTRTLQELSADLDRIKAKK